MRARARTVSASALRQAVAAVSSGGVFHFTWRNLFYELVRREALPAPAAVDAGLDAVRKSVRAFERRHGRIEGLIRPERFTRRRPPARVEPDVYDYSVRRVLVFDRLDTMLLFATNGFYRRIEVGLVALDGFPAHVWAALRRQLRAGTPTTFLVVHDGDAAGLESAEAVARRLARYPKARVVDVGVTFGQAMHLGVPIRRAPGSAPPKGPAADRRTRVLLRQGSYAHFEEMAPLRAMRWVYRRLAKGHAEVGFG